MDIIFVRLPIGTMVWVTDRFNSQTIISEPYIGSYNRIMYEVVDVYGFKSHPILEQNIYAIKKIGKTS